MNQILMLCIMISTTLCDIGSRSKTVSSFAMASTAQPEVVATALAGTYSDSTKVDFKKSIQPILSARCQPCHFAGGKMYAALPFDDPKTITKLGERLFSRIKDAKEQKLIRSFLATNPDSTSGSLPHRK